MSGKENSPGWAEFLNTPYSDTLMLSEKEQLVLDLFNQEEEMRLQRCLLEAQQSEPHADLTNLSDDQIKEQLVQAEREALEARAEWLLRNKIVQNVIVTDPVLKAVHAGANASSAERRLLPVLNERDLLMMIQNNLATEEVATATTVSRTESANIKANSKNKELAKRVLELASEVKAPTVKDITDATLAAQLQILEGEVRDERRKWRVLKNAVAGIIVGSGIDWSENEELQNLVMDDEEELG